MAIGLAASMQSLVRLIGLAFARADLPPDALHTPIVHRTLPWQCPPLLTGARLEKTSMQDHFDYPIVADAEALFQWWETTLYQMYLSPSRCLTRGAYAGMHSVFPGMRTGSKMFRFSTPVNYPEPLDRMAGITFSLEAAHAARLALPGTKLVSNASNYYVETAEGRRIGVADGRPLVGPDWDVSADGLIDEVLTMSRGEVIYDCDFDSIAKARSLLHEYPDRFPEFESLDLALQTLRFMTWGNVAPSLFQAVRAEKSEKPLLSEKLRKLKASIACLDLPISDRAKLIQMHGTLVPDVISVTAFRTQFYAGPPFPYMAVAGKMDTIRLRLQERISDIEGKL